LRVRSELSPRRDRTFVKIRARARLQDLLESELLAMNGELYRRGHSEELDALIWPIGHVVAWTEVGEFPREFAAETVTRFCRTEFERLGSHRPQEWMCAWWRLRTEFVQLVAGEAFRSDLY